MPTGTPFNSCVPPYDRIRIDDFSSTNIQPAPVLHFLSHTHSDHVNGLSAKSFGHTVYCSEDAKRMLLKHEVLAEREYRELELRAQNVRTFSHLKVDPVVLPDGTNHPAGSRDLLRPLPLRTPTSLELSASESVTVTLLEANHCPGAVMFLIEGSKGAVLHTGDFRAEPWFLDSLKREPYLQPYLYTEKSGPVNKVLDTIFLDTACAISTLDLPTKDSAITGLIDLMKLFPETAYFYINSWTWGYEDVLKAIAQTFQEKIHVDRYKHGVYTSLTDPYLRSITTRDSSSTRFHACERFNRCEHVSVENTPGTYTNATSVLGHRVVYVNFINMDVTAWDKYLAETKRELKVGEVINNLLVPFSRHSHLPELQSFVSLFRPRRIVPNTLDPRLQGLDWQYIEQSFAHCLHPSARSESQASQASTRVGATDVAKLAEEAQNDCDVSLKNLVGEGAEVVAAKWADGGKLLKKLEFLRSQLAGQDNHAVIDTLLGVDLAPSSPEMGSSPMGAIHAAWHGHAKAKGKEREAVRYMSQGDDDTDDDDDARGKTAHLLFAGQAGIIDEKENIHHSWWQQSSSPGSQMQKSDDVLAGLEEGRPLSARDHQGQVLNVAQKAPLRKDGSFKVNMLTPSTTPVRPRPVVSAPLRSPGSPLATKSKPADNLDLSRRARSSWTPMNVKGSSVSKGTGTVASPIQLDSSPLSQTVPTDPLPQLFSVAGPSRLAAPPPSAVHLQVAEARENSTPTGEAVQPVVKSTVKRLRPSLSPCPSRTIIPTSASGHRQAKKLKSTAVFDDKRANGQATTSQMEQMEKRASFYTSTPFSQRSLAGRESGTIDASLRKKRRRRFTTEEKAVAERARQEALKKFGGASQGTREGLGDALGDHGLVKSAVAKASQVMVDPGRGVSRAAGIEADEAASSERRSAPLVRNDTTFILESQDREDPGSSGMNLTRRRKLQEAFTMDVLQNKRPTIPRLKCTATGSESSQSQGQSQEW